MASELLLARFRRLSARIGAFGTNVGRFYARRFQTVVFGSFFPGSLSPCAYLNGYVLAASIPMQQHFHRGASGPLNRPILSLWNVLVRHSGPGRTAALAKYLRRRSSWSLERFSLRWNQFSLGLPQCPLGFGYGMGAVCRGCKSRMFHLIFICSGFTAPPRHAARARSCRAWLWFAAASLASIRSDHVRSNRPDFCTARNDRTACPEAIRQRMPLRFMR